MPFIEGPLRDWRPLAEDVTSHAQLWAPPHPDGRMCGYHHRLGCWTFEGTKECLRDDHPDLYAAMTRKQTTP